MKDDPQPRWPVRLADTRPPQPAETQLPSRMQKYLAIADQTFAESPTQFSVIDVQRVFQPPKPPRLAMPKPPQRPKQPAPAQLARPKPPKTPKPPSSLPRKRKP